MNLDEMVEDTEEQVSLMPRSDMMLMSVLQEKSSDERSDVGSQAVDSDYDVDEEYDNDYAENYFDNGEGDDMDDLGGGGGEDGGGGMLFCLFAVSNV
jgi:DNA-directed RNA polymerase III subunit RPC7